MVTLGICISLIILLTACGNSNQSGLDKFLFGQAASMVQSDVVIMKWLNASIAGCKISTAVVFFLIARLFSPPHGVILRK